MNAAVTRVATDTGGTFTDLVAISIDPDTGEAASIRTAKTHTTPGSLERGVLAVIRKGAVPFEEIGLFVHGSTIVINALTERKGVKTGLVTTQGFRDVLEIARGNRPDLFNFRYAKPRPFVPRYLRRELPERIDYQGRVVTALDTSSLEEIVSDFKADGVASVAVCYLHAYVNPAHELETVNQLRKLWPGIPCVASHQITREWREYERTTTTVLCAYVLPIADSYLKALAQELTKQGVRGSMYAMQSNGGMATFESARQRPIALVESGPASGVLGAASIGKLIGRSNIIALDIGGTTAKCSLIDRGQVRVTSDYYIERTRTYAGYPIMAPVVDIVEIGSGGGSIAWLDPEKRLHVGPQSAGAVPGPVAYGMGGLAPTTTDANLLKGRINPHNFLGGDVKADMTAVHRAFEELGVSLGVDAQSAAAGIIRVANSNMINALKLVSLNRGYDPRDFTLVAFGGGGGMHAVSLAAELNIPRVVIPMNCAVFAAWGMLMSDLRRDYVLTLNCDLTDSSLQKISDACETLERQAKEDFAQEGVTCSALRFERFGDMRYAGQEHTVRAEFPQGRVDRTAIAGAAQAFTNEYQRQYRYALPNAVQLVNLHIVALGEVGRPAIRTLPVTGRSPVDAVKERRHVEFDDGDLLETPIYDRTLLEPEMRFNGPAIIEEPDTTIVVPPTHGVEIDPFGNVTIALAGR